MEYTNIHGGLLGTPKANHQQSRREYLERMTEVPMHVQQELNAGKLRLGDILHYSIKPVGTSTTIKMFETQDDKEVGLRSLSNAKLPKNQVQTVSGIYVLAGVAPAATPGSPTKEEIMATPFQSIDDPAFAAIVNGEFDLKVNKVQIVPETNCRLFCQSNTIWPVGYYKLHNPRQVLDDVLLEATFNLGTIQNIPPDTYIYLGLHGTISTP